MSDLETKEITQNRTTPQHQGDGHWPVERCSTIIISQACGEQIPRWKDPKLCPVCLDGKEYW